MKVIVFGGAGFLGSHVADTLSEAGHEVTLYDLRESPYRRVDQRQIIGDILDESGVRHAVQGHEVVFNFAGLADIREAAEKPLDTVKYNVYANSIILEAARSSNIKRFIFSSSLYVYSASGSFYRSSKQACELFIQDYYEEHGLPYTILRFGSLYGPRADERNGVYRLLLEALSKKKITYHGTGEEIREYIHVADAAKLCVEILDAKFRNEHIIITGNQTIKSKDILVMIQEILRGDLEVRFVERDSKIHYRVTPYSFSPRIGKKLMTTSYVDMGEGILEMMTEIYKDLHKDLETQNGIIMRPFARE